MTLIAKIKETLLQTAVIADQNGRKNAGKTNSGNEGLVFLASAIKVGRRRRLQMQLALNNRRRVFNLVCLVLMVTAKGTSQFLVQFVVVVGFFKIILLFSLKNITRSTPPSCLFSNLLHSLRFPRNTADTALCTSSKYISCSRSERNTYLQDLSAILPQKYQTSGNKVY